MERPVENDRVFLPMLIMGYLQVAFNAALVGVVLYFLLQFVLTVRRDVQIKVDEQLNSILSLPCLHS
mgnify:CR=1 FL=1